MRSWLPMLLVTLSSPFVAKGGILVPSVLFTNRVVSIVNGDVTQDRSDWDQVQNPLTILQDNGVGDSHSHMAYSLAWAGNSAHFRIDGAQTVQSPPGSSSFTDTYGGVDFIPEVESVYSVHVHYEYDVPSVTYQAAAIAYVIDDQQQVHGQLVLGYDPSSDPPVGILDETINVAVPAGCYCGLGFEIRLVGGGTQVAGTDSAYVDLNISPVPEPTGLMPLLLLAARARSRNRRIS